MNEDTQELMRQLLVIARSGNASGGELESIERIQDEGWESDEMPFLLSVQIRRAKQIIQNHR